MVESLKRFELFTTSAIILISNSPNSTYFEKPLGLSNYRFAKSIRVFAAVIKLFKLIYLKLTNNPIIFKMYTNVDLNMKTIDREMLFQRMSLQNVCFISKPVVKNPTIS